MPGYLGSLFWYCTRCTCFSLGVQGTPKNSSPLRWPRVGANACARLTQDECAGAEVLATAPVTRRWGGGLAWFNHRQLAAG